MLNRTSRRENRFKRKIRIRKKINGTAECPRLNVFRSARHIYAQLVDDDHGVTLCAVSTLSPEVKEKVQDTEGKTEAAKIVGEQIADKALALGIKQVAFDRAGYLYHGRVKSLAEGARSKGLEF